MSNGERLMQINTLERAISTDINRSEAFASTNANNAQRRLTNSLNSNDYLENGSYVDTIASDTAVIGTPLRADVYEGLIVLPQNGGLNLLISPGAVGMDDPDGQTGSSTGTSPSPDDSRYKVVNDPGILTLGVLVAAANASGSTRIDIVECQRLQFIQEQANRDIYDPTTGTFTPTLVTKVTIGTLTYRLRQGAPGAGLPAMVQGWLPLCVISVPNGATTNDTMTFWDVRPLVKDRINAPFETQSAMSQADRVAVTGNDYTSPGQTRIAGVAMNHFGGYLAGGELITGDGNSYIDIADAANQAAGYTPSSGKPFYVYALFPAGLPRWVRYAATGVRIPIGPRGVITVSDTAPSNDLAVTASVNLPTALGLVGSAVGVALLAGACDSSSVVRPFNVSGGETRLKVAIAGPLPTGVTLSSDNYVFIPGTHFPVGARAVLVTFVTQASGPAANTFQWTDNWSVYDTFTNLLFANPGDERVGLLLTGGGPVTGVIAFTAWIPRPLAGSLLNGYASEQLDVQVVWQATGGVVTARALSACSILGWKMYD